MPDDLFPGIARPRAELSAEKAKKKRIVNTLALVTYIETNWPEAIRINLFTECMKVSDPFPPDGMATGNWRQFCEPADQLEATLHFQSHGFQRATKGAAMDALLAVAHRNAFHPVADYLASLRWDKKPRLQKLFREYFNAEICANAEETAKKLAYYSHIGRCFMVSAVARIRKPGCKVDTLPVLIGPQGFGKSRAIRALCRDDAWFSDDLSPDLSEKDTKDSLVGKWLVELAEIPHVRKEVERVKAFFSRQTDRYRRAYDRMTNDWPRQCVFMGSSNDLEFIDVTGNRRFWPVEIERVIDVAPIVKDRDQLWAEAVHLFENGFEWWLKPDIEKIAAEEQERFREEDMWATELSLWLEDRAKAAADKDPSKPFQPFTLAAAMSSALEYTDTRKIPKADQMRASGCLKGLGYRRRKVRIDTGKTASDTGKTAWLWPPQMSGNKRWEQVGTSSLSELI